MASIIVPIPCEDNPTPKEKWGLKKSFVSHTKTLSKRKDKCHNRKVLHSIKVGTVILIASLINLIDPLYKRVGENAVWVITTVVIISEFSAGATLNKGFNRIMGTLLGGGSGIVVTLIAQKVGGIGSSIIIGTCVFIFGAVGTYTRTIPGVKRTYDYGAMASILTFNLITLSGIHSENVIELARERISTVGIGLGICFFMTLFISPVWEGEDLHYAIASELDTLARCIEGFFEVYFQQSNEKENQCGAIIDRCKQVLYAKSKDESRANFARWEPWHSNFGFSHPWNKYLQIGDCVRELAAVILSLKGCLQCPRETSSVAQESFRETCETVAYSISWTLQELAESIRKTKKCLPLSLINPKLKSMKAELNSVISSDSSVLQGGSGELEKASLVFLLMTMMEKAETLVKAVEELGELANFQQR